MKAVLISIQPKWCELIASGKKTVEVRKTKPKLETPFKVYIYCAANKQGVNDLLEIHGTDGKIRKANGKVIGEFVCDRISPIAMPFYEMVDIIDCEMSCLSPREMLNYARNKPLYGWHISDLVIYDKPKELSEFKKPCTATDLPNDCKQCRFYFAGAAFAEPYCRDGERNLNRPPQSWCYVERLGEGL